MYTLTKSDQYPFGTLLNVDTEPVFHYRDALSYELKQMDNVAAVFPVAKVDEAESVPMYCDFFVNGVLTYSMRRNGYHPHGQCLVEFFKNKEERVLFIFNKRHGELSVCDAKTGSELFSDDQDDKFCIDCQMIDQRYMLFSGWIWSPLYYKTLYDMQKLMESKDEYEPVTIDGDSELSPNFKVQDGKLYSVKLDKSFDPEYVYSNIQKVKDSISAPARLEYVNKFKASENLLKCLLERGTVSGTDDDAKNDLVRFETVEAQEVLSVLLGDSKLTDFQITCTGKVSNADLTYRYEYSLFRPIQYATEKLYVPKFRENFVREDSIKHIVPKVFFNFLGTFKSQETLEDGFVKHIVDIHLSFDVTFIIEGDDSTHKLQIEIDQEMKKMDSEENVCAGTGEVDEAFPCKVVIR